MATNIGSYKGTPISAGSDAQVAAQISAVNNKSTASTNLSNSGLSGGTMSAAQQSLNKIYDTPIGVGGQIDTKTGQILSGPMAGQKAGTDQGSTYTGPAALPQLPQPTTPTPLAPGAADTAATANIPAQTTAAANLSAANLSSTGGASDTVNPFKAAHAALSASGAEAPNSATSARTQTSGVMPSAGPNTSMVDAAMQTPELTALTKLATDYFNPENQRASLLDQYNQMYKESGIAGLDDKILNASNIINGTEDDIRSEIQKSGGFGTDSQVQAMAQSRNKVLLQNYNTLVEQKKTAEAHLNTMVGLAGQDRAYAQQQFQNQLSVLGQMATFRQQATNNIKEGFNNMVAKIGYAGAYQAYKDQPAQLAAIEQVTGLGAGGLAKAAAYVVPLTETEKLDNRLKQAQIANINSEISHRNAGGAVSTQVVDIGGKKLLINSQTGETIRELKAGDTTVGTEQLAVAKSNIDQISGLLGHTGISSAVGPSTLARGTNSFWGGVGKFAAGALGGAGIGAAAGAPFGGIGAIPGAIGGAVIGGLGATASGLRGSMTGQKQDFIGNVQQVQEQLTLQNLQNAKQNGATFGALSEGELKLLESSSSKLGSWVMKDAAGNVIGYNTTEKALKQELNKINNFAKLDYLLKGGDPSGIGVQQMNDGTYWTQNSDGSMTQLK